MYLQDGTLPLPLHRREEVIVSIPNGSEWAVLGGIPTEGVDIPISSVFILLFGIAAVWHLYTYFWVDRRRLPRQRHFFAMMLFVFSTLRMFSLVMRIIWAASVTDPHIPEQVVAVPARTFTTAGNTLIYILNFFTVRRFNRDYALFGAHPAPLRITRFLMFATLACLVMIVTSLVDSYHEHTDAVEKQGRAVQLAALTILTVLAFCPIIMASLGHVFRDNAKVYGGSQEEKRRYKARMRLIMISSLLMTLDVGYECGVAYARRPVERPAWWHHRAALYLSDYLLELLMVALFGVARLDRRFKMMRASERLGSRDGGGSPFGQQQRQNINAAEMGMAIGAREYYEDQQRHEHGHGLTRPDSGYAHAHDDTDEHDHEHEHNGFWKEMLHIPSEADPHGFAGESEQEEGSGRERFSDRINTDEDIFGSG
ncbi:hypothetical protein B0T20DRAFT_102612 [Sordaria brevicollis]|uniref:Uncharacterized protein n=1 Tax=Sordaria brevicollis TaxID=83679 RepID=A0AAE0NWD3_SORBR|nr:hypothetical protein B0T20DRAFT_102612 [Sordaria brevicollis]